MVIETYDATHNYEGKYVDLEKFERWRLVLKKTFKRRFERSKRMAMTNVEILDSSVSESNTNKSALREFVDSQGLGGRTVCATSAAGKSSTNEVNKNAT